MNIEELATEVSNRKKALETAQDEVKKVLSEDNAAIIAQKTEVETYLKQQTLVVYFNLNQLVCVTFYVD